MKAKKKPSKPSGEPVPWRSTVDKAHKIAEITGQRLGFIYEELISARLEQLTAKRQS